MAKRGRGAELNALRQKKKDEQTGSTTKKSQSSVSSNKNGGGRTGGLTRQQVQQKVSRSAGYTSSGKAKQPAQTQKTNPYATTRNIVNKSNNSKAPERATRTSNRINSSNTRSREQAPIDRRQTFATAVEMREARENERLKRNPAPTAKKMLEEREKNKDSKFAETVKNTGSASKKGLLDAASGHAQAALDTLSGLTSNEQRNYTWLRAAELSAGIDNKAETRKAAKGTLETSKQLDEERKKLNAEQEKRQEEFDKKTKNSSGLQKAIYGAAESGAGMATDLAIGRLTGTGQAGSLASMFSRTYGTTRGQAEKEGATENEDRLYAGLQAVKEVGTELMFPGVGLAKGFVGKGGIKAGEKLANALTKNMRGKAADVAYAGFRMLGGITEENLEELAGWGLDPFIQDIAYGRNVRARAKESLMSDLPEITSREQAEALTARLNSDSYVNELAAEFKANGLGDKEAKDLATKMRDFYAAYYSGDTEKADELGDDLAGDLTGVKKISKESFSTSELLETIEATTLLTATTGLPGTISTAQRGNQIKQGLKADGLKALAKEVMNSEDAEASERGKIAQAALESGKDITSTQAYDLEQGLYQQQEKDVKRQIALIDTASKQADENGYVAPYTIDEYGRITSMEKATRTAYNEAAESASETLDHVDTKESLTDIDKAYGARAIAGFKTGAFTVDDANTIVADETIKDAFKAETGIDLGQYEVKNRDGSINIPKTNAATKDALFAMATDNLVKMAETETANWKDVTKGETLRQVTARMGAKGGVAAQLVLNDVDERDTMQYRTMTAVSDYVYQSALNLGVSWEDAKDSITSQFSTIPEEKLRTLYDAGLADRQAANDKMLGVQTKIGEAMSKSAGRVDPTKGNLFIETEETPGSSATEVFRGIAESLGIDIYIVDDLPIKDKDGKNTGRQANGQYFKGDIYINVNSTFEENLGFIFMHEVTHHLKQYAPEQYKALENLVREEWFKANPEEMLDRIARKIKTYEDAGQTLTEEEALEEIIADSTHEFLMDKNFAEQVSKKDPSLAKAVLSAIKNLLRKLRQIFSSGNYASSKTQMDAIFNELGIMEEAEKLWLDAYTEAVKNKAAVGLVEWQENVFDEARDSISETDSDYMAAVERGDMETAQRMVDEAAAEAMPNTKLKGRWYHGTENEFTEFNFSQGGKNGHADGYGIYLTNDPEVASSYGTRMIEGYVNVERPASALDTTTLTNDELHRLIARTVNEEAERLLEEGYDNLGEAKFDTWISNYTDTRYAGDIDKAIDEVIDSITNINGNDYDIVLEIMTGMGIRDYDEASKFYDILTEETGIDGFETKWGDESEMADPSTPTIALAFRSNQIKDASPVTYDDDGNVIPLSERFNIENPDIRYSISEEAKQNLEDEGLTVLEGDSVARYSLTSLKEEKRTKVRKALQDTGRFTDEQIDKWIEDIWSIAAIVEDNREKLDYWADRSVSSKKSNSDYKYTFDFSTLCPKRTYYQGTLNAIYKVMPDAILYPEDLIHVRKLLKDAGYQSPCGFCYVESERKWLDQKVGEFLKQYKGDYIPKPTELTATDSKIKDEHPEVWNAWLKFRGKLGQGGPRLVDPRTDYRGEILRMSQATIDELNSIGGLRFQSYSDFEVYHMLDMMQAIRDAAARGLKVQMYTKIPMCAEIFGSTGIKINLSLVAKTNPDGTFVKDSNGNLVFDDEEGMPYAEAKRLRDMYPENVGTILVGHSEEHIIEAMKDDRIDFIIPFHQSGWSMKEFAELGLKGYKDISSTYSKSYEVDLKTGKKADDELYSGDYWEDKDGKWNAIKYLGICKERGVAPMFSDLLHDNGDGSWSLKEDGSTDGYWKLLIDGKMYDNDGNRAEQQPVKPEFNMEAANRLLDETIKTEGDADTLPVAPDVVKQFVKEFKQAHPETEIVDAKYSIAADLDDQYMDAYFDGDDDAMQELVDEAAKRAGYTYKAYHHTEHAFTVFDRSKARRSMDIQGFYFSSDPEAEREYGSVRYDVYLKIEKPYVVDSSEAMKALPFDFGTEDAGVRAREWLQENGYDAVIRDAEYYGSEADEIIVFEPEQIKSSEPMLFEDDPDGEYGEGEVIPLSQRFDPSNPDIRYSLPTQDSDGNILTDGQMEYFKNSQARDSEGKMQVVYHTTNNGGFTIFDPSYSDDRRSLFFASNFDVSQTYGRNANKPIEFLSDDEQQLADEFPFIAGDEIETKQERQRGYYSCYLNLENPLVVDAQGASWNRIPYGSVEENPVRRETLNRMEAEAEYIINSITAEWDDFDDDFKYGDYSGDYRTLKLVISGSRRNDVGGLEAWTENKTFTADEENWAGENGEYTSPNEKLSYDLVHYWESLGLSMDYYEEVMNTIDSMDGSVDYEAITHNQEWAPDYITSDGYKMYYPEIFDEVNEELDMDYAPYEGIHAGTYKTRQLAKLAQDSGYDGVVIRNCYDIGALSHLKNGASALSDIFIAFSSNQVKDTRNENPSENPDIRYSIPPKEEMDASEIENAETTSDVWYSDPVLREYQMQYADAEENFISRITSENWNEKRETKGIILNEDSVKVDVRNLVKTIMKNSEVDKQYDAEVTKQAENAVKAIFTMVKSGNTEEAAEYAWEKAEVIVRNVEYYDDDMYQKYKGVVTYLADTKIAAPEALRDEESFAEFVIENKGKFLIKKNGEDISNVYQHLNTSWPKLFPKLKDPVDMFLQIAEILDEIQPYTEAYSSEEAAKLTETTANALIDIALNGEAYQSAADIMEDRAKAMKQRHEEAMRKVRIEARAKTERQKERADKWKQRYQERIQKDKADKAEKKSKKAHRKSFDRILDNYKTLTKWVLEPTKEKNVPEEFRKSLAEFLQTLDLQTENSKKLEEKTGHVANKTLKMRELKDRLNALADSSTDSDGNYYPGIFEIDANVGYLMDALTEKLDGKSVDAVENEDIRAIDIIFSSIIRNIQRYKQVKLENKQAEISEIGERCVSFLRDKRDRDGIYGKREGVYGALDTINITALTPAYLFDRMGPLKEMYDVLRHNGFDTYIRNEKLIIDRMTSILGDYYKGSEKKPRPGSEIEEWRDNRSAQTIELEHGKNITMTVAQMMSLYCLVNRGTQATDHMTIGGIVVTPIQEGSKIQQKKDKLKGKRTAETSQKRVLTEADMQTIISKLTPEQIKIADQLQELMSKEMARLGNEAHRDLYGYNNFTDPNYFPIKVSGNELSTDINTIGDVVEKIKSYGPAKPVTPGARNALVIDDIFTVVADHCNGMNLYNSYLVPITDFMKVLNYSHTFEDGEVLTMKDAIEQAYGKDVLKYIMNLMKDINGIKADNRGGLEGIMNDVLGKAKKTAVFGNIRVALQQPTAIVRACAVVDPKYFAGIKINALNGEARSGVYDEMYKYCPIALWKSWGYYDTYMGRDIEDVMMNNWSKADVALSGIYGSLDNATWSAIWQAVKKEQMDKHPNMDHNSEEFLQMCGRRASEVFDKTQVVDSTFHRSDAMRSKQVAVKAFTAFMAEPTLTLNVLRGALFNASEMRKAGDHAGANRVIGRAIAVLLSQAITVAAAQAFADAWRGKDPGLPWGDDDDDDEEKDAGYWTRWLHNFIYNTFDQLHLENNMYLIKDVTPYINFVMSKVADYGDWPPLIRAIMGWDQDYLYSQNNLIFSSLENTANGISQAFKKLEKGEEYDKGWYEIIQKTSSLFGVLTGIPASTLMRDFKPIWDKIVPAVFAADSELEKSYSKSDDTTSSKTSSGSAEGENESHEGPSGKYLAGYDDEAEKIASSVADKTGEEREKATWKKVSEYIKEQEGLSVEELVAEGRLNVLEEYRDMYTGAGNTDAYFDERIVAACKKEFKKTINYDQTKGGEWRQTMMRHFMTEHGMTDADVSAMVYKSETAKDLKVAMRIGDEELIQESLAPLAAAGITQEDLDKLWDNRNRVDLKKYKDGGGRYADKLKSMGTFIWPTKGVVTSHFGYRNSPTAGASSNHPAIDIGASQGTPVVAADGGVVIYAGNNGGYGNSVGIKHDNGMVTYYNHLYAWNVKVGDTVGQGQQIAQVGSTGISTGPHLDFKILDKNGKPVDPEKYLN